MEKTNSNTQFKGKDSHIQNDRIKFQKNNGTLSMPLYNSKSKDIGTNPSGYLPFVTPQGIKYIPIYNTNYGSSGSRGPISKLSSVNGKVCNLCFSNCNKNYSNYDDCNVMCDCTCNQCNSCVGCDGCNSCRSCNTNCNGNCYGCQSCTSCDTSCNGSCNTGCYGTCYGCHGCDTCETCDSCQGSCYGCHGSCNGVCNSYDSCSKCHQSCNSCDGDSCSGCVGSSNCRSLDGACCNSGGEAPGSCVSCDGHCSDGPCTKGTLCYNAECVVQGTYTPCGDSSCSDYDCYNCYNCNSCQSCNSSCNGTCNGGCVGCQGCNSCYDKCNNPGGGCNTCNSCNSCQTCIECQTCVSCQSCNSECYEENADYNITCETWYAGSRRALNK